MAHGPRIGREKANLKINFLFFCFAHLILANHHFREYVIYPVMLFVFLVFCVVCSLPTDKCSPKKKRASIPTEGMSREGCLLWLLFLLSLFFFFFAVVRFVCFQLPNEFFVMEDG